MTVAKMPNGNYDTRSVSNLENTLLIISFACNVHCPCTVFRNVYTYGEKLKIIFSISEEREILPIMNKLNNRLNRLNN